MRPRMQQRCRSISAHAAAGRRFGARKADSGHAGSLNLYSFVGDGFSDIDEVMVTMFVTSAEATVWNSRRAAEALSEVDDLRHPMITRATIERAKGVLMAARAISSDAAFSALTEQSQRENTRLAVVASRIVGTAMHGRRDER